MNFEPKQFFIGVVDFFSVMVPGSLLTFQLMSDKRLSEAASGYPPLTGAAGWLAFLFASYVIGHFIFLVGAALLDDYVYDPVRGATRGKQIERLAKGKGLSPEVTRRLARSVIKGDVDDAQRRAVRIKEHYTDPLCARASINAFQWCKARLALENHTEALEAVLRFEADSKFFRSFSVVIFILFVWKIAEGKYPIALAGLPFLALALWRFVDQRLKAVSQAYWYIIALEAANPTGYREPRDDRKLASARAGGVVYRAGSSMSGSPARSEYLVVQAKDNPKDWVLPKGHIEPDESAKETAVREVLEETGIWARVRRDLGTISFVLWDGKTREDVNVRFFLMEAIAHGKRDEQRAIQWLSLEDAINAVTFEESKALLRRAEAATAARA